MYVQELCILFLQSVRSLRGERISRYISHELTGIDARISYDREIVYAVIRARYLRRDDYGMSVILLDVSAVVDYGVGYTVYDRRKGIIQECYRVSAHDLTSQYDSLLTFTKKLNDQTILIILNRCDIEILLLSTR